LYPIKSTEYVSGEKAERRVASTGREGVRRVGSHREKKTGTTDRSMTREMWTHGVNPIKSTAYVRLKKVARRVASTGRAGVRVATEKKRWKMPAGRPRVREEQLGSRQELGDTGGRKCFVTRPCRLDASSRLRHASATSGVASCCRAPLIFARAVFNFIYNS
jgi:hypothetical protein